MFKYSLPGGRERDDAPRRGASRHGVLGDLRGRGRTGPEDRLSATTDNDARNPVSVKNNDDEDEKVIR